MIHLEVTTPIFLLRSPKYASAVLDVWLCMETTGYLPSRFSHRQLIFTRSLAHNVHPLHQLLFSLSVFYTMSTYTPNGICVTNQPHPKPVLGYEDSISTFPVQKRSLQNNDDDQHRQCKHGQTFPSEHRRRHNIRLRKIIFLTLLVLLALCGLLAWSCINWHGWSTGEVNSLVGRDFNDIRNWVAANKCQYSSTLFFKLTGLNLRGFSTDYLFIVFGVIVLNAFSCWCFSKGQTLSPMRYKYEQILTFVKQSTSAMSVYIYIIFLAINDTFPWNSVFWFRLW